MPDAPLRCLSIRQPWAWAICAGLKRVENRSWANDYRGPVAIHAGASKETIKELQQGNPQGSFDWSQLTLGAIVGVADLVDVVELNRELEDDPDATGPFCWIFANGRLLAEPIPFRGKLQLFHLDEATRDRIRSQADVHNSRPSGEMIEAYGEATRLPQAQIAYWRAESYSERGQLDDAIRHCTDLLELEPENAYVLRLRGALHLDAGRFEQAAVDCDEVLRLQPNDARTYWLRSYAFEALGSTDRAEADFRRAIELDPSLASEQPEGQVDKDE